MKTQFHVLSPICVEPGVLSTFHLTLQITLLHQDLRLKRCRKCFKWIVKYIINITRFMEWVEERNLF
jgi:hypothetical protein